MSESRIHLVDGTLTRSGTDTNREGLVVEAWTTTAGQKRLLSHATVDADGAFVLELPESDERVGKALLSLRPFICSEAPLMRTFESSVGVKMASRWAGRGVASFRPSGRHAGIGAAG